MTGDQSAEGTSALKLPVQRLCNEIQLFDLCDLETCSSKEGKFCTNSELLTSFERISDAEVVRPDAYISEELEEGEEDYDDEYDDVFDEEFEEEAKYDDY